MFTHLKARWRDLYGAILTNLDHCSIAVCATCLFLPKDDTRRAVFPLCAPTTCVLASEVSLSLRAFWRSDGDAVRKPTTAFQRLLALSTCSDAKTALSATRASLSASSVSQCATMLLGVGRSSASISQSMCPLVLASVRSRSR